MKSLSNIVGVLALIWLGSCTPAVMVNSDYDRGVNFREYTSYKVEPAKSDDQDPVLNSQLNQRRIKEALVAEMKARGYLYKEDNPDVIIRYQTDVQNLQETQHHNTWGYWGWWGRPNNTYTRNYQQGRLIVNIMDAKTDRLVWQGWADGEANNSRKQDRDAVIRMLVSRIMEEYPHRVSQPYNETATSKR